MIDVARPRLPVFLRDFQPIAPRHRASQEEALEWLAQAHARFENCSITRARKEASRFGCGPDRIQGRGYELEDFGHLDWERMRIFNPVKFRSGAGMEARTRYFAEAALEAMERFYPIAQGVTQAPDALIHVTCTGYDSPSVAQKWVARSGWPERTQVLHVYHMGCYAAMPAIRVAQGWLAASAEAVAVDVVHTELCTLHLDLRSRSPQGWVQESLFGDGLIRYRAGLSPGAGRRALEVVALRDLILPDSSELMRWSASDWGMSMVLSPEIPERIARGLRKALVGLIGDEEKVNELRRRAIWAIHPGGPKIVDQIQQVLELEDAQVRASREVLRDHGNMSSATLPHVWHRIVEDRSLREGTPVVSLAFGPGLTISGAYLMLREGPLCVS